MGPPPGGRSWPVLLGIPLPAACPRKLVLLDGTSFQVLARVELPLGTEEPFGHPTVSLSADGQLVLVTLSAAATEQRPLLVPTIPLPRRRLTDRRATGPTRQRRRPLRWLDPVS
jgi:hypothetical protein